MTQNTDNQLPESFKVIEIDSSKPNGIANLLIGLPEDTSDEERWKIANYLYEEMEERDCVEDNSNENKHNIIVRREIVTSSDNVIDNVIYLIDAFDKYNVKMKALNQEQININEIKKTIKDYIKDEVRKYVDIETKIGESMMDVTEGNADVGSLIRYLKKIDTEKQELIEALDVIYFIKFGEGLLE